MTIIKESNSWHLTTNFFAKCMNINSEYALVPGYVYDIDQVFNMYNGKTLNHFHKTKLKHNLLKKNQYVFDFY